MNAVEKILLGKPKPLSNEVHIWRITLPLSPGIQDKLEANLSETEIHRMNLFRFLPDRNRFKVARGGLREILASYLDCSAKELNFHYSEYGKPFLNLKDQNLHFNVSHSNNMILYAVSSQSPLGIDVEYCQQNIDFLNIAKEFCSEQECQQLLKHPLPQRMRTFYHYWVRKEAFVKALGQGLYFPLKEIELNTLEQNLSSVIFLNTGLNNDLNTGLNSSLDSSLNSGEKETRATENLNLWQIYDIHFNDRFDENILDELHRDEHYDWDQHYVAALAIEREKREKFKIKLYNF